MGRNILLLTGNGFLGKNLVNNLNKKENKIHLYIRKKNSKVQNNIKLYIKDIFKIQKIDIKNPIVVLTTLNDTNKKFEEKFKKLLEIISHSEPIQIILISSVSVYAKTKTPYSKNCMSAETNCKKRFKRLTILRVGNIFGEYRTNPSYIEKLLISSLLNNNFSENKLNLTRSYIHVEEFCKAVSKIINKKTIGYRLYNLSNKNYIYSSYQIKKLLFKKLNLKINLKKKKFKTHIIRSIINSNKFEKDFNFKFEKIFLKRLIYLKNYYKKLLF